MSALAISGLIYFEYLDTHVLNVLISFIWLEELLYFFLVQLQSQESSAFIIFLRHGKAVLQNFQSHYIFSGYNGGSLGYCRSQLPLVFIKIAIFFLVVHFVQRDVSMSFLLLSCLWSVSVSYFCLDILSPPLLDLFCLFTTHII